MGNSGTLNNGTINKDKLDNGTPKDAGRYDGCPSILNVSMLFSVVVFLLVFIGVRAQAQGFYSGVIITEFGIIAVPPLIMLLFLKCDIKKVMRLNKVRPLTLVIVFFIMLSAIPLAGVFNFINLWLTNQIFGKVIVSQPPVAHGAAGLIVNVLVIGGAAGICEEILFRGVIQRGLERRGPVSAILTAAFLFSLIHMDFQKIFGTFFLGALIGFLVYRSNSLFSGIFAHFANNSAAVVITYASTRLMEQLGGAVADTTVQQADISAIFERFGTLSAMQLQTLAIFYGMVFFVLVAVFAGLVASFIKVTERSDLRNKAALPENGGLAVSNINDGIVIKETFVQEKKRGILWVIPGVLLIFFVYYILILNFKGITSGFAEFIARLLGI